MHTGLKITAFAAALGATFGVAYGVGDGVGPVADAARGKEAPSHDRGHKGAGGAADPAGGLQVSEGGYSLDLKTPRVDAEKRDEVRFVIRDGKGRKVTSYQREHGKELHLILASRDLATYRHLHPDRAKDGTWSTKAELPEAGDYRLFADFVPAARKAGGGDGKGLTLGADLAVAGDYEPEELPEPSRTAEVDGYTVTLDGRLNPGSARELTLKVSKDGKPVTDLKPYLGAYGHLVALRSGDLAYLHVHPGGEPGDGRTKPGPGVSFTATAPSKGAYRLFFEFRHDGKVRTADFTVRTGTGAPAPAPEHEDGSSDGHGH
ncbi:MAG: hypothetical protein ACRDP3_01670 [Streptomyces sp.]|uniref:hypothetical protein n=1 Tax=Streptomyces sp. TaxID=1931 RepID=UPI003D6C24F5